MKIKFHKYVPPQHDDIGVNRRTFLMTMAAAGVSGSAVFGDMEPAFAALNEAEASLVLHIAKDIYPHHDLLGIEVYQAIADGVVAGASEDEATAQTLSEGLAQVEEQAQALFGSSYKDIEDADAREGLLRKFQNDGFFQSIRWASYFGIYNNPELWPKFGYQGSSVEQGGYLNRGFSDITFVPQGPSLEERTAAVKD